MTLGMLSMLATSAVFPAGQIVASMITPQHGSIHARDVSNPQKAPSTSSLLFGFLISFLVLFVVLMGFGLRSRYTVDRRRRERLTPGLDLSNPTVRGMSKPVFWDVWTVRGREKWHDMMPLAAEVRSRLKDRQTEPPERSGRAHGDQINQLYHGFGRVGGLTFAALPHRAPHMSPPSPSRGRSRIAHEAVDLQIAVLVMMPSSNLRLEDGNRTSFLKGRISTSDDGQEDGQDAGNIVDVAVGVATLPWDKERLDFG